MTKPASTSSLPESFSFTPELLKQLTFVINKVAEKLDHQIESVMTPHKLAFRQYRLLVFLKIEGPQAQIMISQQTGLDRTSVMRTVDLLEQRGLVRRDPDPSDRRKHSVVLTPEGDSLLALSLPEVQQAEREIYAALSEQEQAQLLSLLTRLLGLGEKA